MLPQLTEQDIRELGLPLGPRRKLLTAIAGLKNRDSLNRESQAERRQLTVMFVDLVGSTALSSKLDPEDLRELILAYQKTVVAEILRFEGYIARYMGDGVLAYFGWPQAHEDAAERAVQAALALTAAVAKLSTPDGVALASRTGIATGLVVVGDLIGEGASQEQAVVGETPNLAARLQSLAQADTVVISKLEALLAQSVADTGKVLPLIAAMLSVDSSDRYPMLTIEPQQQKKETLAALAQLVAGYASRQPLLMVIEDAHWMDPSSQQAFDVIFSGIVSSRILLIVNHRPEYQCPWPPCDYLTQLSLNRLEHTQARRMIEQTTGGKALPDQVIEQIISKTDGIPLFIEELTKTVLESGLLARNDAGFELIAIRPDLNLSIPSTLQDSLMARLDRLSPVKEIAQIGACIGRTFSHSLIAALFHCPWPHSGGLGPGQA